MVTPVMADDPMLIRMEGKEIRLSDFLWYFQRLGKGENVDTYFQRFMEYQLKMADAESRQLDTMPDFKRQCRLLQARVVKRHFLNHQSADSYCQTLKDKLLAHRSEKEWVRMEVFTYYIPQHATAYEEDNAVRVMDEWHRRLVAMKDSVLTDYSWALEQGIELQQDGTSWIPVNQIVKEWVHQQASLAVGSWSEPFYSPLGIHLVCVKERSMDPSGEWDEQLRRHADEIGNSSPIFNHKQYQAWVEGTYKLPNEIQRELAEVHDGLLAMYWDSHAQMNDESNQEATPAELRHYFQSHKEDYRWEYPHFKGAVIHCLSKKMASKIKKRLKKLPMNTWEESLKHMQQEDANYRGELECGLYQIGKNPYVDKLAFKCGDFQPLRDFPYTFLLGKKLKKGPEDYTDVLQQVVADYQRQHEKDRFSRLFRRFNVEIDKDVLKTVNSCGNK